MPRDPEQQAVADWLDSKAGVDWQLSRRDTGGNATRHHRWIDLYPVAESCGCMTGEHCAGTSMDSFHWRHVPIAEPAAIRGSFFVDVYQWGPIYVDDSCPLYSAEYRKAKADAYSR